MRDFNHTINVLVRAYLNDTLHHGICSACAVGNIVHAAGAPMLQSMLITDGSNACWKWVFYTDDGFQNFVSPTAEPEKYRIGLRVIEATGYSVSELARVEFAFESAVGESKDDMMFSGLMAVVDVLADIHGIDLVVREETKKLFVKV